MNAFYFLIVVQIIFVNDLTLAISFSTSVRRTETVACRFGSHFGVGKIFESVCLSGCPQYNSKTKESKVFKLGIGNDLEIS